MPRTVRPATLGGASPRSRARGRASTLLPLLFVPACQGGPSSDSAPVAEQSAAIVDGKTAPGAISVVAVLNAADGSLCTGAVISERIVLTAKHCVQAPGAS